MRMRRLLSKGSLPIHQPYPASMTAGPALTDTNYEMGAGKMAGEQCWRGRKHQRDGSCHSFNFTFTLPKRFAWPEEVSTTVTRSQLASMEVTVSVTVVDQVSPRSEENCGV